VGTIRLVLALAVLVAHVGGSIFGIPFFAGDGYPAVSCFFAISGFYMSLVLNTKYAASVSDFYAARILRLYPLYFLVFACTLFLQAASYVAGKPMGAFHALAHEQFQWWECLWGAVANLSFIGSDALTVYSYFFKNPSNGLLVLPIVWSLGVELFFYLLAPFILRRRLSVILVLTIAAILLRLFIAWTVDFRWSMWTYYFAPSNLAFFLAGALAHRVYSAGQLKVPREINVAVWVLMVGLLLFASEVFSIRSYTVLYILLVAAMPSVFELTKDWKWDRAIGEFSYPVYLIHCAILTVYSPLRHFIPDNFKLYAVMSATIVLSSLGLVVERMMHDGLKRCCAPAR
jgi:peptidoglycan/LPS O-acetylase OafA/YrhL